MLYELQFGKSLNSEVCRFSIRMTAREKRIFEKVEKIFFHSLLIVSRLLLMVIAVLAMWGFVVGFILLFG